MSESNLAKYLKVRIEVSHLERGQRAQPESCPIALAIREQHGLVASVDKTYVDLLDDTVYMLPEEASHFVESFDKNEEVKPFEFDMIHNPDAPPIGQRSE